MSRAHLIFLLVAGCVGCADSQLQRALTPRSAAEEVPVAVTPNTYGEHDRALAEAIDRSLLEQEEEPSVPALPAASDKETSATRDVHAPVDNRASKTVGVAP
jgi:hypothetical protein